MKSEDVKALISYRMEQAQAALEDAQTLLETHRSTTGVVNRSYYAAFYAGLDLLQTIGKGSSKHSGVISLLHQGFFQTNILPREYGRIINRLFELRQKSDYEVTSQVEQSTAIEVKENAANFVNLARQFLTEQGWL